MTELSLKLTLVYVQSDGTGNEITNNGTKLVNVVSGDGTQLGNEVCIKNECFYVMHSNETSVTMLAKYNLYVGGEYFNGTLTAYRTNATGIQNAAMRGYVNGYSLIGGVTPFSSVNPVYSGSIVEGYVIDYHDYLSSLGVILNDVRLITYDELTGLGCSECERNCSAAPEWVCATSYWSSSVSNNNYIWFVDNDGVFYDEFCYRQARFGVRPVIAISKDYLLET